MQTCLVAGVDIFHQSVDELFSLSFANFERLSFIFYFFAVYRQ